MLNRKVRSSIVVWLGACLLAGASFAVDDCRVPPHLAASRPDPESGPTEVTVGSYLLDLRNVDDSKQSFEADIFFVLTWMDPRLVAQDLPTPLVGCTLPMSSVWNPLPEVVNERDVRRRFDETVTVDETGLVRHVQRIQGEFTVPLDLREFPFDSQRLSIEIVARNHTPDEVAFVLDKRVTGMEERLTLTDWTIGATGSDFTPKYLVPQARYLSQVQMYFEIHRDLRYYYLKIFLPLTLIICMSWAVFWINPNHLPAQIGVSTSAVLTLIAFQFSLGYMLPRLAYLTRADRFVIGSTFLVFGAFGEALVTSYLAEHGKESRAVAIDRVSRWLYPLMFVVVVLVSSVL
jgi:gamma-aminobutyric acid receptor subunit beta